VLEQQRFIAKVRELFFDAGWATNEMKNLLAAVALTVVFAVPPIYAPDSLVAHPPKIHAHF